MIVLSALLKTCYEFNATSIFYEGFLSDVLLGGAFLHNASSSFFFYKICRKYKLGKCHRRDLVIGGCQTDNYVEAQSLVLKDTIFS